MAIPLLQLVAVTKGLREALPFLEGLVARNPAASATSILKVARDAGLSFRDAPAFQLVGQLKSNLQTLSRLRLTDFAQVPSDEELEVAVTPLRKNYSYLVGIQGTNPLTGGRERRFVTVVSDNSLSPNEVFQTALEAPSGREGSQILNNQRLSLDSAKISPLAL